MDHLTSFSLELRQLRESRQISLQQISAVTRVNVRFLEALERGKFDVLPEVYIRAFLRQYAEAIGADEREILRKYEEAVEHDTVSAPAIEEQPEPVPTPVWTELAASLHQKQVLAFLQRNLIPLLTIITVVLIVLFLARPDSGTLPEGLVAEVPFDRVVKESEAAEVQTAVTGRTLVPKSDSLRLEIVTSDSVWIQIVIDGARTEEYLFPPQRRRSWTASERFSVTMGNAGGATFLLNGKDIGALGRPGAIVRNALITLSSADQL
jgi:transcriptional regulator with XRE-family HTH domain